MSAPDALERVADDGPAPAERLAALTDVATPMAVRTAVTLRVPDLVAGGTDRLDDLAAAAGADADALGRLLRYLAHRGLFTEPEPGMFALTDTGRLLCDQGPGGQREWLDMTGLGFRMDLAYTGLLHAVRTGEEAYTSVHGHTFWADLDADPARQAYLDSILTDQHARTGPQVAQLYDWSGVGHLVDVGGGSGALLRAVLTAHPHLRGTLFDRPAPAAITAGHLTDPDLAGRVEVVEGDFFTSVPAGGDVYVISRAITDWNDRAAVTVLTRAREAAGERGKVLVVEVLPTEPHVPNLAPFDLQMLAVVGGKERTLPEFTALARAAGLTVTDVVHGPDGLVLIECAAEVPQPS